MIGSSRGGLGSARTASDQDETPAASPGSGAVAGKIVRTGAVVPADATDTNLAPLGPGVIQQLTPADAVIVVAAMLAKRIPFGNPNNNSLLATDPTFVRVASSYAGQLIGIGTADPFVNSVASGPNIGNGIDLYSPVGGNWSQIVLAGYSPGKLIFAQGSRPSSEWMPGFLTCGDGGIGFHEGHISIFTNKLGDLTPNNMFLDADFYAGSTSLSGGAAFPGGLAVGFGFHGAQNGLYDPTAGGPHIDFAPSGADVSRAVTPGTPTGTARLKFDGTDTLRRLLLSNYGGAYSPVATLADLSSSLATNPPPNVTNASAIGISTNVAREDHTHGVEPAALAGVRNFTVTTDEVDLLTTGVAHVLIPTASPLGSLSGKRVIATSRFLQVTALTGTVTGAPQWKAGNDGSHLNFQPAAVTGTGTTTAAVGQCASSGGGVFPVNATDMTAGDIQLEITAAATGTGLTVFKGKFVMIIQVLDL